MGNGIENAESQQNNDIIKIDALEQETVQVPSSDFIANSTLSRDGQDLTIEAPNGETIVISNYFMADPAPAIEAPNGTVLTQNLVQSFLNSGSEYASNNTMNDESPVGAVEEMSGEATVTRVDGTTEPLTLGTPIFNGDVIETSADGAVNILFIDETSMAVSESARMSVDNYDYQAETESGVTNLSVLRGVFVYTSGLIGRDDPDDVSINTPVGSIGIRGTIIAGKIVPDGESEITVVEGAIVVKNATGNVTLSEQYETVKIGGFNAAIEEHGVKSAEDVGKTYGSVSGVTPGLFSSINDNAREEQAKEAAEKAEAEAKEEAQAQEEAQEQQQEEATEEKQERIELKEEIAEEIIDTSESQAREKYFKNSSEKAEAEAKEEAQAQEEAQEQQQEEATEEKQERIELKEEIAEEIIDTSESQAREKYFKNSSEKAQEEFAEKIQEALTRNNVEGDNLSKNKASLRKSISKRLAKDLEEQAFVDSQNQNINAESQATLESKLTVNGTPLAQQTVSIVAGSIAGTPFLYDLGNDGDYDHVRGQETANAGGQSEAGAIEFYHVDAGGNVVVDQTVNNPTPIAGDHFGSGVAFLGDFNGDGETDFIVGAADNRNISGSPSVNNYAGSAFVFSDTVNSTQIFGTGSSSKDFGEHVFSAGDLNGDGLTDAIISGESSGYVLMGQAGLSEQTDSGLSKFDVNIKSAGAAGDINGDGNDDFGIIVNNGGDMVTYIVYGDQIGGVMDAAFLNNPANALKIVHEGGYSAGSIYEINALGDINGDGFDDFRINNDDIPFVVHGQASSDIVTDGHVNDSNASNDDISASGDNQSLVGNGDFHDNNRTGISMRGGDHDNVFNITKTNITDNALLRNIDGGTGHDTIKYGASGGTLDFSAINYEKISQVEEIEFADSLQTIILTEENLFNFLKTSDSSSLHITGDGTLDLNDNIGSTTSLTSLGFTDEATTDEAGYDMFTLGNYTVYVDDNLTVV